MQGPDFYFEKKVWRKGFQLVIGVDEVGRGALAGPVVAGAACVKTTVAKPVVAGATTLNTNIIDSRPRMNNISNSKIGRRNLLNLILSLGINDSKKLSPQTRNILSKEIRKYFYWSIGEGSVTEINKLGIVKATEKAMRRAIKNLELRIKNYESRIKNNIKKIPTSYFLHPKSQVFVLSDAFHINYVKDIGLKNQLAIVKGDQKSVSIAAASIIAKVYRDKLMEKIASKYSKYGWEKNKGYGTDFHRKSILEYGITKIHRRKFVRFALNPVKIPRCSI